METRRDVQERLINRAARDEAFRKLLLEDPYEAVREETGVTIPPDYSLEVHEEGFASFHLVLPATEHLSEADLAVIAGGQQSEASY